MNDDKVLTPDEIKYLIWFRENLDYDPGNDDIVVETNFQFENDTGCRVPARWMQ
jgi:hypothetical protein